MKKEIKVPFFKKNVTYITIKPCHSSFFCREEKHAEPKSCRHFQRLFEAVHEYVHTSTTYHLLSICKSISMSFVE